MRRGGGKGHVAREKKNPKINVATKLEGVKP